MPLQHPSSSSAGACAAQNSLPHPTRRLLLQAGASALAAPALVGLAQNPWVLKFHTFMGPTSNVWLNMHRAWMNQVEQDSGGRIRFEAYPAMQLGGTPAQLFDQVRDGVADIAWTLLGYTAGRFVRSEVFELPFMTSNAEASSRAFWAYVQANAKDEFKDVHPLALHVHGPGVIHTIDKPIHSVSDMKGLKLRAPTRLTNKLLAALGAVPVGMPLPAIADALSKRTVVGCLLPWEVVPSVKVQELTKFHTEFSAPGRGLYTATCALVMNRAKYEQLPLVLKEIIDKHSGANTSAWLGKVQQAGDALGRKSALDLHNTLYTASAQEAAAFRQAAQPIEQEWLQDMDKRHFNGKALLADARALIERYTPAAPFKGKGLLPV